MRELPAGHCPDHHAVLVLGLELGAELLGGGVAEGHGQDPLKDAPLAEVHVLPPSSER